MMVFPFQVTDAEYSIGVIMDDENLSRLREYDPAEVTLPLLGSPWREMRLRDIVISYATADEQLQAQELIRRGRAREAMRMLSRGYRYRPDLGDAEDPEVLAAQHAGIVVIVNRPD